MNNQHNEIILAGFGGQGILFSGKVLGYAGLAHGKQVSWLPSYGPEMRGGTANCHVIISEDPVASPIIMHPTLLIVMNKPSLEKFENSVEPGGTIVIDSSMVDVKVTRDDVTAVYYPATKTAKDTGGQKGAQLANMLLLGKAMHATGLMSLDELKEGIKKSVPKSKQALLDTNFQAVEIGFNA
jgi:Pyruvate:ferredoxin oxidoreductase and related 2-oxoacid:ferredoxin oxidoreductases, gamma subunit